MRLLDDVVERSTKVRDLGLARLIECADSALAALIANDARTRKHCLRAGERHLAVPASSETALRRRPGRVKLRDYAEEQCIGTLRKRGTVGR